MIPEDRALASFLAERLMGWSPVTFDVEQKVPVWVQKNGMSRMIIHHWYPFSRDDHALMVARAMVTRGWLFTALSNQGHNRAAFERVAPDTVPPYTPVPIQRFDAEADSLPRAIAEAARAALEGEQT